MLHKPETSSRLTVGAKAFSKHCHRDETSNWWGKCTVNNLYFYTFILHFLVFFFLRLILFLSFIRDLKQIRMKLQTKF